MVKAVSEIWSHVLTFLGKLGHRNGITIYKNMLSVYFLVTFRKNYLGLL